MFSFCSKYWSRGCWAEKKKVDSALSCALLARSEVQSGEPSQRCQGNMDGCRFRVLSRSIVTKYKFPCLAHVLWNLSQCWFRRMSRILLSWVCMGLCTLAFLYRDIEKSRGMTSCCNFHDSYHLFKSSLIYESSCCNLLYVFFDFR